MNVCLVNWTSVDFELFSEIPLGKLTVINFPFFLCELGAHKAGAKAV